MRNLAFGVAAALAAVSFSAPATAGLDGTSIAVDYRFPDLGTVYPFAVPSVSPFIVGAGMESVVDVEGVTFIDVDFSDLGLTLTFNTVLNAPTWNVVPFNGLVFTGTGLGALSSATLLGSTTFGGGGFTQDRVTLSGNQLQLNWAGVSYRDGQQIHISFGDGGVIPEPATWAMLILGFGLIGASLRRQRATAAA